MADDFGQGGYPQPSAYDQSSSSGYPQGGYDQSGAGGIPQGGYPQGGYEDYGGQPSSSAESGMAYLKSPLGMIKIGQIACLLIAFASLSTHTRNVPNSFDHGGRFDFFYFATVTTWLIVIGLVVVFYMGWQERYTHINLFLVMMVYSTLTTFLLLVSTSLVLDVAVVLRRKEVRYIRNGNIGSEEKFCDYFSTCGNVEAAGAFGIFATALFLLDAVYYFYKNRVSQNIPTGAQQM